MINSAILNSAKLFLDRNEVKTFASYFENIDNFRFVGGVPRNLIMGKAVSDYDIATIYTPDEIINICEAKNIIFKPTGLKHGTITIIVNSIPFEVTTLRLDTKCNGRHADVTFTNSWEEDSKRRDLTINAIYMDFAGNFYDYNNGINDALHANIKFIGDPYTRINEDYLRILRFFRFWAVYGKTQIDDTVLEILHECAPNLKTIAFERIKTELDKILLSHKNTQTMQIINKYAILAAIDFLAFHNESDLPQYNNQDADMFLAYSYFILFYNPGFVTKFVLSKAHKKYFEKFTKYAKLDINYSLYYEELEFTKFIALYQNINLKEYLRIKTKLPINNRDIIDLGLNKTHISSTIKHLEKLWIDSKFTMQRNELLHNAKVFNELSNL